MEEGAPGSTAVRIASISAAQNKRGKNCFEGGMKQGSFTWYKDMGGNSNWMYLAVSNATKEHLSLALWLLYEAATEPLVDPLCSSGEIQVGFFNQSKNMNRQVPLFELAEESKPMLEMDPGDAATLKVRINDLSSHHQNQRFILVAGPADAPIRGSRSVPIEIMSKPRVEDKDGDGSKRALDGDASSDPAAKRSRGDGDGGHSLPLFAQLAAVTDPSPSPERQAELAVALLGGLHPKVRAVVAEKLAQSLDKQAKMTLFDQLSHDLKHGVYGAEERPKPKGRLKSLAKAIVEFKRNEKGGRAKRGADGLGADGDGLLSEQQLTDFFVDEDSGINIFDALSPKNGDAAKK